MVALSDLSAEQHRLLAEQTSERPSWAFGNSGTRFKVFTTPGTPRDAYEKISDAAQVHAFTGVTPRVSLHIPWDLVDSFEDLRAHADSLGVELGTINSNVFQDNDYKFGSLTNSDPALRRKAIDEHLRCIDVMRATGSKVLKIWLADGTNYPGQDSIADRQARLADSLAEIYAALDEDHKLLLEYKFFEPAFYHTDVPDWGTSLVHCLALGERAKVVETRDAGGIAYSTDNQTGALSVAEDDVYRARMLVASNACGRAASAPSISTRASTPTMISSSASPTPSSSSGSCTRSSPSGRSTRTRA